MVFALTPAGCNRKDEAQCQEAMKNTRQALKVEDFGLARQWRTYTYKQCEDAGSLKAIDQEIVASEAAVAKRKAEAEAKEKEQKQVVDLFSQWVASHRAAPEAAAQAVVCELEDDEKAKKSKERFCTRTRSVSQGKYTFEARYWEAEPAAVRFGFKPALPLKCEAFGTPTVVRTWQVAATGGRAAKRTRCSLTAGPLAGLHAMATEAAGADQYVFTPQYVQKDPVFAARLTR